MILPSSLVFFSLGRWAGVFCDLRWMQAPIPAVALAMARRAVRRSVRQRLGRTKFAEPSRGRVAQFIHRLSEQGARPTSSTQVAEPSSDRVMRFTPRGAETTIRLRSPFLMCAFGEQGRSTALTPLLASDIGLPSHAPSLTFPTMVTSCPAWRLQVIRSGDVDAQMTGTLRPASHRPVTAARPTLIPT